MKRILFAASECVPFIKTGGLADVCGALPKEFSKEEWDVRVVIPNYSCIPEKYRSQFQYVTHFYMCAGNYIQNKYVGILKYELDGVTYYFIDNQEYFTCDTPYGDIRYDIEKFVFFDKAVLSMLKQIDFRPDLIHCHDWETGLIPVYLKNEFQADSFYWGMKSIITIHNLKFQGVWDVKTMKGLTGFSADLFAPDKLEFHKDANMLKGGLVYADYITTVSAVSYTHLEKLLDKIERIEKPTEDNTDIRIVLEPNVVSGNDVLKVEGLAKAFPPLQLFSGINFEVKRGERVALIGNNGTGKTTILKIINELISPDAGTVTLGSNVHIGYYDQEHQQLHMEKTIFDEIADDYPNLNNTKVRNVLAAFLFTDDDVYKRIEDLSGGERGRVALAKLMLSDANFLILDEPTNHLDITSKEILEEALKSYTGTVFFVSHDRYFINQTATRILELTGETVVNYIGNYDYYLEKHDQMVALYVKKPEDEAQTEASVKETAQKVDWQTQKAEQARIRKIENALKKAEEKIAELEEKIASIDAECAKPEVAVNSAKLGELTKQQSEYQEELEKQYEVWEELSMELDA